MSTRGKRFSPLVTAAVSARLPHWAAESQVRQPVTGADLGKELFTGGGDEGGQEDAADAGGLQEVVQHVGQAGAVGRHVLGQGPGHGLVDVLVGPLDDLKDLLQGVL